MTALKSDKNRGYLIAGIGAFVALFAFLYLPYVSLFASVSSVSSGSFPLTTTEIADFQWFIWLEGLLALAILVLAGLLIFRTNPFGSSRTPIVNQIRMGIYGLGGGGILCIVLQFLLSLGLGNAFQQKYGGIISSTSSISSGYDYGSWLYLLGMIAVIAGSVVAYQKSGLVASTPGASSYSAQLPSMPYAVPGSSPYDSSYPTAASQGSVPPYQQNVQPSSPYDAQSPPASWQQQNAGVPPQYQVPNQQVPQGPPPQYQVPNQQPPQGPPQQWPPSYPSS